MTSQPIWNCIGHIGDVDPIAYGGGFVYEDITGVYGPEMTWFEPSSDEEWHKTEGATPLQVYRVMLESSPSKHGHDEWWYSKLDELETYTGTSASIFQSVAHSDEPMKLALLYADLISYFGVEEFDSYPNQMTEDEAYAKYAQEMKVSRS